MARLTRRDTVLRFAIIALLTLTHPTSAKQGASSPKKLGETSVGRFKVTITDDRLPLEQMEKNKTSLLPNLDNLWFAADDYWSNFTLEETPPEEEQLRNLSNIAKKELTESEYNEINQFLLDVAKQDASTLYPTYKSLFPDMPHPDIVASYFDAIVNLSSRTQYYMHGAYLGVGRSSKCSDHINDVLSNKDEWEKMGSSAATTLMALLPTFLAFGNLFVPRSSEAYTTSALVGLTTAFFTFGLPVKSMSAVKQSNVHSLAIFGIATLTLIAKLGTSVSSGSTVAKKEAGLEDLQSWSEEHNGDEVKARFVKIKELVEKWDKRW